MEPGGRRPPPVPRRRPAVADRLPGHAPRAADPAGPARWRATRCWWCRGSRHPGCPVRAASSTCARGPMPRIRSTWWSTSSAGVRPPASPCPTGPGPRRVLALQHRLPGRRAGSRPPGSPRPIRAVKDADELAALRAAGAAADRVAGVLQSGGIPLVGRTEAEVSADLGRAAGRRGPPRRQLRHRRQRAQRRQPPPRAGQPGHRPRRDGGVRLRWHPVPRRRPRLLLGHHPHGGHRHPDRRGRRLLRRAARGPAGGGGAPRAPV